MSEMNVSELPALIAANLDGIRALCVRYGVERLDVFGSITTDEFDPETSDVDFLVSYKSAVDLGPWLDEHLALKADLESLLGRDVDLIFDSPRRNPIFNRNVTETRRPVYAAEK